MPKTHTHTHTQIWQEFGPAPETMTLTLQEAGLVPMGALTVQVCFNQFILLKKTSQMPPFAVQKLSVARTEHTHQC